MSSFPDIKCLNELLGNDKKLSLEILEQSLEFWRIGVFVFIFIIKKFTFSS